jgi:Bacterial TSP3 repeat
MPSCAHDNRCSRRGPAVLASIAALAAMLAVPLSAEAAPRDRDHDHLSDRYEVKHSHTNPRLPDTDGDRLRDGFEVRHSHTNPRKKDTDGDGLTDGYELKHVNTSPSTD